MSNRPFHPSSGRAETPAHRWREPGKEPGLDEVLADPLVHLVMRRDCVTPEELRAVIAAARARLSRRLCCCLAA